MRGAAIQMAAIEARAAAAPRMKPGVSLPVRSCSRPWTKGPAAAPDMAPIIMVPKMVPKWRPSNTSATTGPKTEVMP